jgi:3-hydroxyacyl-CoA dehydrogenase
MLQDGVVSAEDIDTAMTLAYRRPLGLLRITDVAGLDVRLAIAEHPETRSALVDAERHGWHLART